MSDWNEPFRGICPHVDADAEAGGDGYTDYCARRGITFPCNDTRLLGQVASDWRKLVTEKYGRSVVWVGPEEFYSVNLCRECVQELLAVFG